MKFEKAIGPLLEHEGGFNDIKEDRGGATNYGISLRFLKKKGIDVNLDGKIDWYDVKWMTEDQAIEYYRRYFWHEGYDELPDRIASKTFNFGVNAGNAVSNKILQRSVNAIEGKLKVDGVIGPKTVAAVKKVNEGSLLFEFVRLQSLFYADIVIRSTDQKKFLRGWLNRAFWLPE